MMGLKDGDLPMIEKASKRCTGQLRLLGHSNVWAPIPAKTDKNAVLISTASLVANNDAVAHLWRGYDTPCGHSP